MLINGQKNLYKGNKYVYMTIDPNDNQPLEFNSNPKYPKKCMLWYDCNQEFDYVDSRGLLMPRLSLNFALFGN